MLENNAGGKTKLGGNITKGVIYSMIGGRSNYATQFSWPRVNYESSERDARASSADANGPRDVQSRKVEKVRLRGREGKNG